jgi:arylsulfatase A-like enzyme
MASSFKRIARFLFLIIPVGILIFLISFNSSNHVLKGNYLPLIDNLSDKSIEYSPQNKALVQIEKEKLSRGWRCIAALKDGNRIWETYTSGFMVSSVRLFRNSVELRQETDLFEGSGTNQWNFDQNHIFLRTSSDPQKDDYFVDYKTFSKIRPEQVNEEQLGLRLEYAELSPDWKLFAYPTRFPLWIQSSSPPAGVSISRKKTVIPFRPQLLDSIPDQQKQEYGWNYFDGSQEILFQPKSRGVLRFTDLITNHVFRKFLRSGIVSLHITAKADLIESTLPRLGIFLDSRKIDSIEITSNGYQEYSTKRFVIESGMREIRIELEKIEDLKYVSALQIVLEYSSAFVIAQPENEKSPLKVNYPSACPFFSLANYYQQFPDRESNSLLFDVNYGGEVRRSLPLLSDSKVAWRVKVPLKAKLNFEYAFSQQRSDMKFQDRGNLEINIAAKRIFRPEKIIYSLGQNDSSSNSDKAWRNESIDLSEFAGKTIDLSIDVKDSNGNYCPSMLYISDFTVSSGMPEEDAGPQQIILISADALRADHLGTYGYFRNTSPSLDAFAKESIVFENAISQANWTLPSFASLFTSLYPSFHRAYDFETRPLTSKLSLIPVLKKAGFHTAAFVDNPCLNPFEGFSAGFDRYAYETNNELENVEEALRWIKSVKKQKFFLFLHFLKPHEPYTAPDPFSAAFKDDNQRPVELSTGFLVDIDKNCKKLSDQELQFLIAQYDSKILYLDSILNRFLKNLKELGIYKNALIIFLSDHGESFREHIRLLHGYSLYQEEIHVPLIMKFPDKSGLKGRRIPSYVRSIDVVPTILNFANLKLPEHVQGASLLKLAKGNQIQDKDQVILSQVQYAGKTAIIRGHFKYIHSDLKQFETTGVPCFIRKSEEFYDLASDPKETNDVILEYPEMVDEFRKIKLNFEGKAATFLKNFSDDTQTPFVLEESVKEELRALGYIR